MTKTIFTKLHASFILLCLFALLAGCDFEKSELPEWQLNILGPLAQTEIAVGDVPTFSTFSSSTAVKASELGILNGTYPVLPAFSGKSFTFSDSIDEFVSCTFLQGDITISLRNNYPFSLKSGMKVDFISEGTTVFSTTFGALNANGGTLTGNKISLAGKTIASPFQIKVSEIASDGTLTPVSIGSNSELVTEVKIENVKISRIRIKEGTAFSASNLSDFSFTGEEVPIKEITGAVNINVENKMPVDFSMQIYFYDQSQKVILDKLFDSPVTIKAASVDAQGRPTTATTTKLTANITKEKYAQMKNAKFMKAETSLKAFPGVPSVEVAATDKMLIKLIGNLTVVVEQ